MVDAFGEAAEREAKQVPDIASFYVVTITMDGVFQILGLDLVRGV